MPHRSRIECPQDCTQPFRVGTIAIAIYSVPPRLQSQLLLGLRSNGGHKRVLDRRFPRGWRICRELHPQFDVESLGFIRRMEMAKEPKKLDDLFHDTLKDIYFAEKKILTALPKMAKAAQSEDLRAAFEKHHGETEGQVERLERVFDLIGKKAQGKTCDAIIGIVEEGQEVMKEYKGSPALDAGLLAGAQAVEHYEISRYGTLKTWANELGLADAVGLLDATLQEEKNTDATLTKIAESVVNQEAA
jgi:ferritin-like metal-binding protein YciE